MSTHFTSRKANTKNLKKQTLFVQRHTWYLMLYRYAKEESVI